MLYTSSRAGQQSQRLRNWAKSVQHMENVQVSCFTHSIIIELQVDFHYFPKYRSIMCAAFLSCVLLYKVFSMISTELSSHLYNLKHSTKKDQKVCFKSTQYLFRQCWIKFFFLLLIQIHSIYKVNWTWCPASFDLCLRFSLTNFTAVALGCRADNRIVGVPSGEDQWAAAASERAEV